MLNHDFTEEERKLPSKYRRLARLVHKAEAGTIAPKKFDELIGFVAFWMQDRQREDPQGYWLRLAKAILEIEKEKSNGTDQETARGT